MREISLSFTPREHQKNLFEAIEEKGYKRAILVHHRRCLSGDSHIIMANGSYKFLKDVLPGDSVLSWDGENFVPDIVRNVWKTEEKDTFEVQALLERPLICSGDHKIAYMHCGFDKVQWCTIDQFKTHPSAMTMRYAGSQLGTKHDPDLLELYGYLLADGYICGYQQPKFTNTNMTILKRVEELAVKLFDVTPKWRIKGNGYDLGFSNGHMGGGCNKNPIKELFRKDGLDVPKSKRSFPKLLLEYDKESLLRFFAALISADGSLYKQKEGYTTTSNHFRPASSEITISCGASYDYAWGIYWLLRKMGIEPRINLEKSNSNWRLTISRSAHIFTLLKNNRIYGKEERQELVLSNVLNEGKERQIHHGCYRSKAKVTPYGREELYDMETTNHHNFIANGYLVHNSGKDVACWNLMVRQALMNANKTYVYCLPKFEQARDVIWNARLDNGQTFHDFIPQEMIAKKLEQKMAIVLKNGSQLMLAGSDSYDRLVGMNFHGLVLSEGAIADLTAWSYFLPILEANDGWAVINSTPRGTNAFYDLWNMAIENPDKWFTQLCTIKDTGLMSQDKYDDMIRRGEISEEKASQEFLCSFSSLNEKTYYGRYIDDMRDSGRIGDYPWDPRKPVFTSWDWGHRDQTVCVFAQFIQGRIIIIDCYANKGEGMEHYAKMLQSKPYSYGAHVGPHDMRVHELSSNNTRWAKMHELGYTFKICPSVSVQDGIEAVRTMLPRTCIAKNTGQTKELIKALENYRSERIVEGGASISKPVHDSASDYSDCVRYFAIVAPNLGKDNENLDRYRKMKEESQSGVNPFFR
jgi:phage terminase large subunit